MCLPSRRRPGVRAGPARLRQRDDVVDVDVGGVAGGRPVPPRQPAAGGHRPARAGRRGLQGLGAQPPRRCRSRRRTRRSSVGTAPGHSPPGSPRRPAGTPAARWAPPRQRRPDSHRRRSRRQDQAGGGRGKQGTQTHGTQTQHEAPIRARRRGPVHARTRGPTPGVLVVQDLRAGQTCPCQRRQAPGRDATATWDRRSSKVHCTRPGARRAVLAAAAVTAGAGAITSVRPSPSQCPVTKRSGSRGGSAPTASRPVTSTCRNVASSSSSRSDRRSGCRASSSRRASTTRAQARTWTMIAGARGTNQALGVMRVPRGGFVARTAAPSRGTSAVTTGWCASPSTATSTGAPTRTSTGAAPVPATERAASAPIATAARAVTSASAVPASRTPAGTPSPSTRSRAP